MHWKDTEKKEIEMQKILLFLLFIYKLFFTQILLYLDLFDKNIIKRLYLN